MEKGRIDKVKLNKMLREGKTQRQAAVYFGVSDAAISKAKKELKFDIARNVGLESAGKVMQKGLNAFDQLQKINDEANRLLDMLEQDPDMKIKVMREIRGQLKLQLELFQALYDVEAVKEFQEEVLSTIGEASPEVKNEIIRKLSERRAIRRAVKIN